jgi:hypothetical protein
LPQALAEKTALSYLKKVAIFEDERSILKKHVPKDWEPWDGFWGTMADAKAHGATDDEVQDIWLSSWRVAQDSETLEKLGITPWRSDYPATNEALSEEFGGATSENPADEPSDLESEIVDKKLLEDEISEDLEEPAVEEIEITEGPEKIEKIIERGDDEGDRVEVIHDHEEDDKDPLGFDDPEKLELEEEDEDFPFDEELSEKELDRLLKEEEKYNDEDLFL